MCEVVEVNGKEPGGRAALGLAGGVQTGDDRDERRPLLLCLELLRKDLLVLRRSPALLGVLLSYPLLVALLIAVVAGYANTRPRVAFVDLDGVPERVELAGRTFDGFDRAEGALVALVNETMARQVWPGGAIGKRFDTPSTRTATSGLTLPPRCGPRSAGRPRARRARSRA